MPSWIIHTAESDGDTAALLRRRLLAAHAPFALGEAAMGCAVTIEGAKGAELLAEALCEVLCRDLLVFALSAMADGTPFSLEEKRSLVLSAARAARSQEDATLLKRQLTAYLRREKLDNDIEWCYELFPRLKERHWQLAGTLSGGEQQMLAVARALMSRPKLMMMDEPSLGLAPLIVRDIFQIIKEINKQGVTILLIEQNANMALHTADKGYVMETGEIILEGAGCELLENPVIREAYLGK